MDRETRSAVDGRTPASPLTTRETVLRLTPAWAATSFIVARPERPDASAARGMCLLLSACSACQIQHFRACGRSRALALAPAGRRSVVRNADPAVGLSPSRGAGSYAVSHTLGHMAGDGLLSPADSGDRVGRGGSGEVDR